MKEKASPGAGLDLNLMTALLALLETNSVTIAAQKVGVTQPAMSRILGRLRILLDDPLFVRQGRTLQPTVRALSLHKPLQEMFAVLEHEILAPPQFSPETSERNFRILGADVMSLELIPSLINELKKQAPHITLQVLRVAPQPNERPADFFFAPEQLSMEVPILSKLNYLPLFTEKFVTILRAGHPILEEEWGIEAFTSLEHILVSPIGGQGGPVDNALKKQGLTRKVGLWIPGFANIGAILEGTDMITTLPSAQAYALMKRYHLVLREPPLALALTRTMLYWLPRFEGDAGHQWLRGLIQKVIRGMESIKHPL